MKITTTYLRQVIKEELKAVLAEEEAAEEAAEEPEGREEDRNPFTLQEEEEKSPEWQEAYAKAYAENPNEAYAKAYANKYFEIANGLIDGSINPFNSTHAEKFNFTPDDLDIYRDELNMRVNEPYGGSGDETIAMIKLAQRKAKEYANNNS